jgi:hypothetical protein
VALSASLRPCKRIKSASTQRRTTIMRLSTPVDAVWNAQRADSKEGCRPTRPFGGPTWQDRTVACPRDKNMPAGPALSWSSPSAPGPSPVAMGRSEPAFLDAVPNEAISVPRRRRVRTPVCPLRGAFRATSSRRFRERQQSSSLGATSSGNWGRGGTLDSAVPFFMSCLARSPGTASRRARYRLGSHHGFVSTAP